MLNKSIASITFTPAYTERRISVGRTRTTPLRFTSWGSGLLARSFRALLYPMLRIAIRPFVWLKVENDHILNRVKGPIILASNHASDLDTVVILAALPRSRRHRLCPTACDLYFSQKQLFGVLVGGLLTNGLTLPRGVSLRSSLRHMTRLVAEQWSILIFPEGDIADSNRLLPFRPGVGMIATHLGLPVVPVRIDGTGRIYNRASKTIRPGPVRVRFGSPLFLTGKEYKETARTVEAAIAALGD